MKKFGVRCIATRLDDNFMLPFLVMVYSAQSNREKDFNLKIAFFKGQLSEKNQVIISEVLDILVISYEFIPIDPDPSYRSEKWITATSFIRMYLTHTLTEKFLWLEGDLLCLSGWDRIFDDYEYPMEKKATYAVVDTVPLLNLVSRNPYKRKAAILRMGPNYFNAGVLMVNTSLSRNIEKNNSSQDLLENYNELGFQLNKPYDFFNWVRRRNIPTRNVKILHFAGIEKPYFYKKFDFAIFSSDIESRNVIKYLNFQHRLINVIIETDSALGLTLGKMQTDLHANIPNIHGWHHKIWSLKQNIKWRYVNNYYIQRFYYYDRLTLSLKKSKSSSENSLLQNRVLAITISVNLSDVLAYVIEKNKSFFSHWIIVTDASDIATFNLVEQHPGIELLFFDFKKHDRKFNKGGAVRLAQKYAYTNYPDHWYLLLDSDIALNFATDKLHVDELDDEMIYFCGDRRDYSCFSDLNKKRSFTPFRGTIKAGFFQLYRKKRFYLDSEDAASCDFWFANEFQALGVLPSLYCDHLGVAGNWDGTKGSRFIFNSE